MNFRKGILVISSLAFILSINLFAQEVYTIQNKTLKEALEIISKKSKLSYIANDKLLETKTINNIKNVKGLEKALTKLLENTGLKAIIEKNAIVIVEEKTQQALGLTPLEVISTLNSVTEGTDLYTIDSMNTATRLKLSNKETPQSVSVVTRKKLDDLNITDLKDALNSVTGINVVSDSGKYRYQSRGFYVDQIQEDGITTTYDGSMFGLYQSTNTSSDLAIYDHIEVVRGATGLSQGNGEPGGTVNLVRKKPTKQFHSNVDVTLGSWNKRRTTADVSTSLNEKKTIRARAVGIYDKSDSFKDRIENETKEIYLALDFDIGDNTILGIGADYTKKEGVPDYYGLPMGENSKDLNLSRSTYLGASWNNYEVEKSNFFLDLDHSFSDNWKLESKLNYKKTNSSSLFAGLANGSSSFNGVASDGLLRTNSIKNYDNESTVKSFQADLTGVYDLFGQSHEFFTGISVSREDYKSRYRSISNSTTYNIFTFNGNEISKPNMNDFDSLSIYANYKYKFNQDAMNLATRLNFTDSLHLLIGSRYTNFKSTSYEFDKKWGGLRNYLDHDYELKKHRFIPYLGLTYDLNDITSLYASYTSIFKPVYQKDVNGQFLDPLVGSNYEIGVKSTFFDESLNTSFSIFQINHKNRAIYNSNLGAYESIGKVRSRGFEAQANGQINDRLNLSVGYTFNKSKYLKTEGTRYQEGINFSKHTPNHLLKVYTNYTLPINKNKWNVGLGVNAQSSTNSIYNIKQGGLAVWNSSINYKINKNMNLKLNVNNLFDKKYYLNNRVRINGMNNFYGDPRNFLLTLSWKL